MRERVVRVLLIEDDPMVQEINRKLVENVGSFTVVGVADDGEKGLAAIEQLRPDLVLLDIFMPLLDGLETLRRIRHNFTVDVIVVSAASDIRTIQKVLQWGAVDYIIKPFMFERLKQSLDQYFAFNARLDRKSYVSQTELDAIRFGQHFSSPDAADTPRISLPKGLNDFTLHKIMDFLETRVTALSADEVAEGVGMARVTARRYLDYLQSINEVQLQVKYGAVGRPVNRYVRSPRPKRP